MPGFGVKKPVALTVGILPNLETAACGLSASQGSCGESSSRCFASVAGRKRPRAIRALKAGFDFGRAGGRFLKVRVLVTPVLSLTGGTVLDRLLQSLIPYAVRHAGDLRGLKTYCVNGFFENSLKTAFSGGAA